MSHFPSSLPKITNKKDVYEVGSICRIQCIKEEAYPRSPYLMNIIPYQKAKMREFVDTVGTISRVQAYPLFEKFEKY